MYEMDNDAFWNIQLSGHSLSQCKDAIASTERSESCAKRGSDENNDETLSYHWKSLTLPLLDSANDITLELRTACQASMLDRHVGEEVWDAAIIFCSYLCMTKDVDVPASAFRLKGKRVLELGSGVGLLGMTCALFADTTILTDYDQNVLANLGFNVTHNQAKIYQYNQGELDVSQLNWTSFLGDDLMDADWIDDIESKDKNPDYCEDVDILIGSALVYSIQGAYSCADTIAEFLIKKKGREAWVLQLVSRPGFDRFLRRLEQRGLTYTRFEIGEREYQLAAGIEALKTPRDQFGLFVISSVR
jgi:hypothetical protein